MQICTLHAGTYECTSAHTCKCLPYGRFLVKLMDAPAGGQRRSRLSRALDSTLCVCTPQPPADEQRRTVCRAKCLCAHASSITHATAVYNYTMRPRRTLTTKQGATMMHPRMRGGAHTTRDVNGFGACVRTSPRLRVRDA